MRQVLVPSLLMFAISCTGPPTEEWSPSLEGVIRPKESMSLLRGWRRAPVDGRGDIVALTVHYDWREDERVHPSGSTAVLIVWSTKERAFYLFDLGSKSLYATRNFDLFLRELNATPSNGVISWIDTCTASRSSQMPDGARDRLHEVLAAMKARGISSAEPSITCYCESKGITYPNID